MNVLPDVDGQAYQERHHRGGPDQDHDDSGRLSGTGEPDRQRQPDPGQGHTARDSQQGDGEPDPGISAVADPCAVLSHDPHLLSAAAPTNSHIKVISHFSRALSSGERPVNALRRVGARSCDGRAAARYVLCRGRPLEGRPRGTRAPRERMLAASRLRPARAVTTAVIQIYIHNDGGDCPRITSASRAGVGASKRSASRNAGPSVSSSRVRSFAPSSE
jgi:hypothetical protein